MSKRVPLVVAMAISGAAIAASALIAFRRELPQEVCCHVPLAENVQVAPERAEASPVDAPSAPNGRVPLDGTTKPVITAGIAGLLSMSELSRDEMLIKVDALRRTLAASTRPIFDQRFAAGLYVEDMLGPPAELMKASDEDMFCWRMTPDQRPIRTELSRDEYPELYELHDAIGRLRNQVRDIEHREFLARRAEQNARSR